MSGVSGAAAAISFLALTGLGYLAQVVRLYRRRTLARSGGLVDQRVSEGLHPLREMWSFAAFLFFALSGLTRSYVDLVLFGSRLPAVALSVIILWFLVQDNLPRARLFYRASVVGTVLLVLLAIAVGCGVRVDHPLLVSAIDGGLSVVSLFLFYGKASQAWKMYREKMSRGVSGFREVGVLLKDLFGLWYATGVGYELRWIIFTHVLSGFASLMICLAKLFVDLERHRQLNVRE